MRYLPVAIFTLILASPALSAGLDPETKAPYQLKVVVRTGDHPTLTKHFRTEVMKSVGSALQAALGPIGTVEVADLNSTPAEDRDPLWKLVDEKGLEALDGVNVGGGGKTHFIFIDFADGKYEIRTRQHDGSSGFCTPIVRKTVHGDRSFVGRLAGLAVAQDFGAIGTFDPTGPQVTVVLKAGELGAMDSWVKKGDVFAVVQVREGRRALPKAKNRSKEKEKKEPAGPPPITGTRVDGVLLHVVDGPRNGLCVCKLYNRYRGELPRDGVTLGYRAVRLGTGEAKLKLQLTDGAGTTFRSDSMQPRAGVSDFPEASRDREEMSFADGVFTSKETFKNIAFVLVRSGETPVAKLPIEIYPDRLAVRKVSLNPAAELAPAVAAFMDMQDRVRNARVMQARAFEEITTLQQKEKQKALDFGQAAYDSLDKEGDILRADLGRLKERYKADAPPGLFEPCDTDLKSLESKTKDLRGHLIRLKEVIKIENDPAMLAARKMIESLLNEAKTFAEAADVDQAIAKYEEALKLSTDEAATAKIKEGIDTLQKLWEIKSPQHADARKYIYETWVKLEQPADIKAGLPEARKAFDTCKRAGDVLTLRKIHLTGPLVFQKYADNLKKMLDEATEDEDKKAVAAYEKTTDELQKFLGDVAKAIGADK